jgi:hypothetical protein
MSLACYTLLLQNNATAYLYSITRHALTISYQFFKSQNTYLFDVASQVRLTHHRQTNQEKNQIEIWLYNDNSEWKTALKESFPQASSFSFFLNFIT